MTTELLNNLINDFGDKKTRLDGLKKDVDSLNKQLKSEISSSTDDKKVVMETDTYKLSYSITERSSINEDGLLEYLKNSNVDIPGLIKTKEYLDSDILEAAIYNEKIPADVIKGMAQFNSITEVATIRVTPIQGGK